MATDIPNNTTSSKLTTTAESKSKDSKTTDQKKIRIIMEFLQWCSPYESDALRAMLAVAKGTTTAESMPQYDRTAINRYLNFGCDKETGSTDAIREHRQSRALELMKTVSQYVGKEDIINITSVLLSISSDKKDIENIMSNLPKMQTAATPNTTSGILGNNAPSK